ncbi:hypothetical protein B0O99DRAFT_661844 [Bisporella sp. PMI_857]|nr:hypothetical protein B0O99DRAFT_661844 [Bisporella sp. PMI_857]
MDYNEKMNGQHIVPRDSSNLKDMPEEVLEILQLQKSPQFLHALSIAALKPNLTAQLFTQFHFVFADSCSRWIRITEGQNNEVIEAFARILPLAPHLAPYLEKHLRISSSFESAGPLLLECLHNFHDASLERYPPLHLQRILLAALRLLEFDERTYSRTISGVSIQRLFRHENKPVRYLAVRIFCKLLSAAEFKLEQMIAEHVGNELPVFGDFDGRSVDYCFLSLLEAQRLKFMRKGLASVEDDKTFNSLNLEGLSDLVVRHSSILLPRPNGPPTKPTSLIPTRTTASNMASFAKALLSSSPILLHGLAGSGKTALVNEFARELGVESNMVTLHLNEQTDAKMLIGMYTTDSTPGSFSWRAGVLTTAVKEGRWVFIEDLDRAPNEVISVILPLIERGELLIPSRGETIRAGSGFKLFASIRTSLNMTGHENPPALHMLGARLWQRVPVHVPAQDEFRTIIEGLHHILHKFLPQIINVYDRLYALSYKPSFAFKSRISLGRPISPRDLLKWCRRLVSVLQAAGSTTGSEAVSEATLYQMFQEAADCFAGSLQTADARALVVSTIAKELNIPSQTVEHFLTAHIPRYQNGDRELVAGRVRLPKRSAGRITKPGRKLRPFANTNHAKRLLEQVGVAVSMSEPILLVGETGIGKTTVVQQLADTLGFNLTVVNLSQQSEVGDLLGGFKPVNVRSLAIPLAEEFNDLFVATGISMRSTENQKYVTQLERYIRESKWEKAAKLWHQGPKMFEVILNELIKKEKSSSNSGVEQPAKRRKTTSRLQSFLPLKQRWAKFSQSLEQFQVQLSGGSKGFAFTFIEGNIVKAARNGDWVLLDEINLASPDTLESIADLLHNGSGHTPSILLSETGEIERIYAHPNFRIFGAMNPATDVGKKDLPMGLRSRFTEIYVESPDRDKEDLLAVIRAYIKGTSSSEIRAADDVASLYINTKRYADEKRIVDGANQVPHFSLRTLTRVLSYVTEIAPSYGLRRALYEGFAMGFLTLLDRESEKLLEPLINHHLLDPHGNSRSLLTQPPKHPEDGKQYIRFVNQKKDRQYWMLLGREPHEEQPHYIITPFVERNILNLVRATSTRRFPVLVQGPTSSGKTSMIEYLAKYSGNKFVRINNHEHTDLQEYLGTYVSGSDGKLHFQEGLLVQALRQGHWIVLDELNLAPTDVLEALNRLLDDNRELLIPETQEIVRPHENFMLFATQNPPGLYGGRKTLSRAFRNRFLELHFDDIPEEELHIILEKRSQKVAPSDCKRIVSVYKELSRLRQSQRLFEQKDSFATLRDLFRWAMRDAENREQLAANGYMLLGERVRNIEERHVVKDVIESVFKVKIDTTHLYDANLSPEISAYNATTNKQGVVWTRAMRRLYVLVAQALRHNEPVLLVGETGCGKTTVCQMLAEAFSRELYIVNAHQNTETGDLIGAQRPVRNRNAILDQLKADLTVLLNGLDRKDLEADDLDALLNAYLSLHAPELEKAPKELLARITLNQVKAKALFEWSDGSLVQALKEGQFFLLDEISLADDSVLERLNSVLETQRTILLAEKGIDDSFVKAADGFQFFATMNPGGDYGKRELSPALRNRFTEIWVPSLSDHDDVLQIIEAKLNQGFKPFAKSMVQFAEWFGQTFRSSASTSISVRDVLAWVKFMNGHPPANPYSPLLHGAAMVYIDTLGANPAALLAINPENILEERTNCLMQLSILFHHDFSTMYAMPVNYINGEHLSIGGFSISKEAGSASDPGFAFNAPTTKLNAMRVLRALQVQKPILLEGSPGVGKTTLISALARACGRPLTRINLSEQTDLMDLFGSDVPVEGAEAGHFAWRDAPFLQAMQNGDWVLLDEMNLASQSVLEGLNACLDHRGEVYISELDQTFKRHPNFSVFAAQNPHHQGGGRKGLPSSFVNRFTVVYADTFRTEDLELICRHNYPAIPEELVSTIIRFVSRLEQDTVHNRRFGAQGGPWEFNLRDILRWLQLLASPAPFLAATSPADFLNLIFRLRFRSTRDREEVDRLFAQIFATNVPFRHFFYNTSSTSYQVGLAHMQRDTLMQRFPFPLIPPIHRLPEIESVMICIQQSLPCILVGPPGSGKSTILQHIAAMSGKSLVVFPLNTDIDTMDLVGGFEQVDPQRYASSLIDHVRELLNNRVLLSLPMEVPEEAISILEMLKEEQLSSTMHLTKLARLLHELENRTQLQEFGVAAEKCRIMAEEPLSLESARFEWVDGVLINALEKGEWLVLDNANLCSASVLDRLNSLLEPNGYLSINEHPMPNGEPKVVRPHPDFRIFLTMDARFGELSRAMRNRAIEIFLEPLSATTDTDIANFSVDSTMQRYMRLSEVTQIETSQRNIKDLVVQIALENLAWSDLSLLPRYFQAERQNHLNITVESSLWQPYVDVYQDVLGQNFREAMGKLLDNFAAKSGLAQGFRDAQILHPLQNSPLVPLLTKSSNSAQVCWLAVLFELKLGISKALKSQQEQRTISDTLKASQMNRLQISMNINRIPRAATDTTARVSEFLANLLGLLSAFSPDQSQIDQNWMFYKKALTALLQYWWDTYDLVTATNFEEATFQAHVSMGTDLVLSFITSVGHNQVLEQVRQSLKITLGDGFMLSTGLSMETLWKQFRPIVMSKFQVTETLSQLETLAARFDALKWKISISVTELGAVVQSFAKAYRLVLTSDVDTIALLQTLTEELHKLEAGIRKEEDAIVPFLVSEFEALRQLETLKAIQSTRTFNRSGLVNTNTVVLANHPTAHEMKLATINNTGQSLSSIDYLWGSNNGIESLMGNFSVNLLHQLHKVDVVELNSLKLLESELPVLGEKISTASNLISRDKLLGLNEILSQLLDEVVSAHGKNKQQYMNSRKPGSAMPRDWVPRMQGLVAQEDPNNDVASIFKRHFNTAVLAIEGSQRHSESSIQLSAFAWVAFAVGAIMLYVPDKAFDPDKRQRLERDRHMSLLNRLRNKAVALRQFELLHTGQNSNIRYQQLEEDIRDLGEPPEILQEIYRPTVSRLNQLQGEFNNLLKIITQAKPHERLLEMFSSDEDWTKELKLLQRNIDQIIRRLTVAYHAYNDLIIPVINMLRSLQIGLSLAILARSTKSAQDETIMKLGEMTPFLGGRPGTVDEDFISHHPLEYMKFLAATCATEGVSSLSSNTRNSLLKTFHVCYEQWREKREKDLEFIQKNSGLYSYRGSAEDEDDDNQEEFNRLFPAYDEDPAGSTVAASDTTRDISLALAKTHSEIFLDGHSSSESVFSLVRHISEKISVLRGENPSASADGRLTENLLPGALLLVNHNIEALNSTLAASESYDFYADSNLPEVRKLVNLVHKIQTRFRELQGVDEIGHMQPLEDVLVHCRELLQLKHTEPLAKIITKVEKVHAFMHEWQFGGWASYVYGAKTLYDSLTETIISWRRLELSTCEDVAKLWWLPAYEIIIATPLSKSESVDELRDYAPQLLNVLGNYFSTAIVGQFVPSLQLVIQLNRHLEILRIDVPSLSIIHGALSNFIAYYSRYTKPVQETMKDVLLLASWKDTNIVALRDSAKRSHHKLFKIVRKFRSLLGQPMEAIIKVGLPDETAVDTQASHTSLQLLPSVDPIALELCTSSVPNWTEKNKRFVNVHPPESAIEGSTYIDSFLTNILTSIAELQKATPSVLTEENKSIVKHLKLRKTKLFNETLKELRHMGIKSVRDTDALSKQDSISTILSRAENLPLIKNFDSWGLEYYFHKTVDLHSEDLSKDQVGRSLARLEGLVSTALSQRTFLAVTSLNLLKLEQKLAMTRALWSPSHYAITIQVAISTHGKLLQWLPNILKVALEIIQDVISAYIGKISSLSEKWSNSTALPANIISTERQQLERQTEEITTQLKAYLVETAENRLDLAFILKQILPWMDIDSVPFTNDSEQESITNLNTKLTEYKDAISNIPTTTDNSRWFTLYCDTITNQRDTIIDQLDGAFETSETAGAIFAVAMPILEQYYNITHEAVTRYAQLHRATCKTAYILAKTFIQIATQGFCTPPEKADAEDGKTDKLEGGTGLGEGDGAEDISKDIQDDEDLDELAQEPNMGNKEEIEDENDAVDMADGDMEGEMGDAEDESKDEDGSGSDDSGDEMDEEAGDMWDGDTEEAEKDQTGNDSKGKAQKDEQIAAQENSKETTEEENNGDGDEELEGAEQGEEVKQQDDIEKHDPHAEEGEALDLPEDMNFDGQEEENDPASDDEMKDLSDAEDTKEGDEEVQNDGKAEPEGEDVDPQENPSIEHDMDIIDLEEEEEEGEGEKTEEAGEHADENLEEQQREDQGPLQDINDDANADTDNAVTSEVQGAGQDQEENQIEDKDSANKAQREQGGKGGESSEQQEASAEDGENGRQANGDAPRDSLDQMDDASEAHPFKKLGDALESWHRQQTQIRDATEQKEPDQAQDKNRDLSKESSEFQHLQDEDAQADDQAMGTATEEQAHAIDESMAVDTDTQDMPDQFQPDELEQDEPDKDDTNPSDAYEGRAGASINQAWPDRDKDMDAAHAHARQLMDDTHLDSTEFLNSRSAADARQQWTRYEIQTRPLSLSLTEQLRLILAPTLATKMRGDFRTGKRLNIKRIIPYIASQYKRDKIWMRLDDSKSMGESGSGELAMETLVMVAKSLSMLEVGEMCVVGFGESVKVAHDFDAPFSADAGPRVVQHFGFEQEKTDVTRLVRESIELFRTARAKSNNSSTDLWQMELIISDGVCNSSEHEPIRQLLRQALEERIMMVFVIVDDLKNKKKGESVMDLKEAKFVNGEVKIERYLDTFPFQYYLIVSDVKELPSVLATLLRQWFVEVADSSS